MYPCVGDVEAARVDHRVLADERTVDDPDHVVLEQLREGGANAPVLLQVLESEQHDLDRANVQGV
jgi:hypothetical protein